ncbi:flavin reductase family protein [Streptomyces sp. NPDC017435]|uniref:flavin reductase family protein n=1 Tax=Streptomyces sp. NPDC017435 TaxID=3364995 RepID=UPI0037A69CF3
MRGPSTDTSVSDVPPDVLKTAPEPVPQTVPKTPSGHPEGVSNDEFRAAMSRLADGVVLVTAREPSLDPDDPGAPDGEDVGMTATAFMSVSLDPPLVLVGLRTGSRMDDLLDEQPSWAVSVLSENQRHIAGRFAMKGRISDRLLFEDLPYVRGETSGAPLVGGALATLECRTEQRVVAGDHTLVIGRVLTASAPGADGGPLVYFRGRYRQLD